MESRKFLCVLNLASTCALRLVRDVVWSFRDSSSRETWSRWACRILGASLVWASFTRSSEFSDAEERMRCRTAASVAIVDYELW